LDFGSKIMNKNREKQQVIKSKALYIIIMAIIALAFVLPSCAPAATTPAAVADKTYKNDAYGFTVKYPGTWLTKPSKVETTVFYAQGPGGTFDDFLQVNMRPAKSFKEAAVEMVTQQLVAQGFGSAIPEVVSEKTVTLSDGKTQGSEVIIEVDLLILKMGAAYYGYMKDGKAVIINIGGVIKAGVDKYPAWKKIYGSLAFGQ
jgi:hypothetical protein